MWDYCYKPYAESQPGTVTIPQSLTQYWELRFRNKHHSTNYITPLYFSYKNSLEYQKFERKMCKRFVKVENIIIYYILSLV
jgi:hypothetical protein